MLTKHSRMIEMPKWYDEMDKNYRRTGIISTTSTLSNIIKIAIKCISDSYGEPVIKNNFLIDTDFSVLSTDGSLRYSRLESRAYELFIERLGIKHGNMSGTHLWEIDVCTGCLRIVERDGTYKDNLLIGNGKVTINLEDIEILEAENGKVAAVIEGITIYSETARFYIEEDKADLRYEYYYQYSDGEGIKIMY